MLDQVLRFWRNIEFLNPFSLDDLVESSDIVQPVASHEFRSEDSEGVALELFDRSAQHPFGYGSCLEPRDPEWEYGHDFFFGIFRTEQIRDLLTEQFPSVKADFVAEPRQLKGRSCLGRLTFNDKGVAMLAELKLSTLPWAIDRLLLKQPLSLSYFDDFAAALMTTVGKIAQKFSDQGGATHPEEKRPLPTTPIAGVLQYAMLKEISDAVVEDSQIEFFPARILGYIVSYPIRKKKLPIAGQEGEAADIKTVSPTMDADDNDIRQILAKKRRVDILNSFCLNDLERASSAIKTARHDSALLCYLRSPLVERPGREKVFEALHNSTRVDLLEMGGKDVVSPLCRPRNLPLGRWPSDPAHDQSMMQQFAINSYVSGKDALVAVNGPPGTGKTTLIRDIVASLVVKRAIALSRCKDPRKAFAATQKERIALGRREYAFRPLREELRGFEVVVVSNNNSAVENVSKELPKANALHEQFRAYSYLAPLMRHYMKNTPSSSAHATRVNFEAVWGMPSIALGNRRNRMRFRNSVLFDPKARPHHEHADSDKTAQPVGVAACEETLDIFSWRRTAPIDAKSFRALRMEFRELLAEVKNHITQAPEEEFLSALTKYEWDSPEVQLRGSRVSQETNVLRSQLFLKALALHEAWLREVPDFERELSALSALIAAPSGEESVAAQRLWEILFMIVPVVSTTLASAERMFARLPAESLGNLVIDEAGQATPQLAVGSILRARRVLVVGDQRQLEPICQVSDVLIRHFASEVEESIRPLLLRQGILSAQTLADASMRHGTYLHDGDCDHTSDGSAPLTGESNPTWVGIPLIVHRRCREPMFSLANEIAYGGKMINATSEKLLPSYVLDSAWVQCAGTATDRHWVPEQGAVALKIVTHLLAHCDTEPNFFVISPFRAVRTSFLALVRKSRKSLGLPFPRTLAQSIGTVHSFQGKENDIVILLLGCDFQTAHGAQWAGEKPNLLNVAVTRAKHRIYVVGDAHVWHNRGYFSDLQKSLPVVTSDEFFLPRRVVV